MSGYPTNQKLRIYLSMCLRRLCARYTNFTKTIAKLCLEAHERIVW
jgi:hypothetical protein